MLGQDLVPTPRSGTKPTSTSGGGGIGGFLGGIEASVTAAVGSAETAASSWEDGLADKLASKLGIQEFYSLHVFDVCKGEFTPNATSPSPGYKVTNCTAPLKMGMCRGQTAAPEEDSVG